SIEDTTRSKSRRDQCCARLAVAVGSGVSGDELPCSPRMCALLRVVLLRASWRMHNRGSRSLHCFLFALTGILALPNRLHLSECMVKEVKSPARIGSAIAKIALDMLSIGDQPQIFGLPCRFVQADGIMVRNYRILEAVDQQNRPGSKMWEVAHRLNLVKAI